MLLLQRNINHESLNDSKSRQPSPAQYFLIDSPTKQGERIYKKIDECCTMNHSLLNCADIYIFFLTLARVKVDAL